jgi:hypothetical protein
VDRPAASAAASADRPPSGPATISRSLAHAPGTPDWGAFAAWMAWYQGVLEPVLILQAAGIAHPWLTASIRDWIDRCKARPSRLRALDRDAAAMPTWAPSGLLFGKYSQGVRGQNAPGAPPRS